MSASGSPPRAIGFLTVIERDDQGLLGGYLLLNAAGRPLEFHCTSPVKANRAQEILYGASLKPYLCGEQIARTLIEKAKTKPGFVCTNLVAVMCVRHLVKMPVVLVKGPSDKEVKRRIDGAHQEIPEPNIGQLSRFEVNNYALAVAQTSADDQQFVAEQLAGSENPFDLTEPFQRIREAIEEAAG